MNNLVIIVVAILVMFFLFSPQMEKFSASGLAVSDQYCTKLANTYYRPKTSGPFCRDVYTDRICGRRRRNRVNYDTGNYFTQGDILV